ncbi:MAG: ABC transporter permease [Clostridia bacterium]|nr:ABC transporter permease [Clostridia bacterium]
MTKKLQSIISKLSPAVALLAVVAIWAAATGFDLVPSFMLPSPAAVAKAFFSDFSLLCQHARVTLTEAFLGLLLGVVLAFLLATLMDRFEILYKAIYPLLVITQTVPTIAVAPLLVLWQGFGMAPKITLVVLTTFFPIAVSLLDGYRCADPDAINLLRSMGAGRVKIFRYIKFPSALGSFFAGLKVSASYAVVGAVVAEWLGGFEGLGVYMTRVRKAYAFDRMFAVIIFTTLVSLLLMWGVAVLRKLVMPWERKEKGENQ